jgi:dienelactone hydrolase
VRLLSYFRFPSLLLLVLHCLACSGTGEPGSDQDDWVGWAYFEDGSDLPLRVGIGGSGAAGAATFDALVQRMFDLPIQKVEWQGRRVLLERTTSGGATIRLAGERDGDTISGHIDWADSSGRFELIRSSLPLPDIDPESYADIEGTYRFTPTDIINIKARFWGEMVLIERRSGRRRTLFPLAEDRFFLGSALYVPAPAEVELRPVRNAAGEVTHIEWSEYGGATRRAERLDFRDEEVEFESDGETLRGTLVRPAGIDPVAAVVVLGGSSWERRDDIRHYADVIASLGVAALVYDKRGFGESEGKPVVPFSDTARDANAAVELLRARSDVKPDQVGVFGMSRGGWFAPLAASQSRRVAFLVLLVPPAVSPADQETRRRLDVMREEGFPEDDLQLAAELMEKTWAWVRTGEGWQEYLDTRRLAEERGFPPELLEADSRDDRHWEWAQLNMFYDPVEVLRRVRCPVLALYGGADRTVAAEVNRPLLEAALERAGNSDVTIRILPGAVHNLSVPTDLPVHRGQGIGDEGFATIADWIQERLG